MSEELTSDRIARLCKPGVRLFTIESCFSTPELTEVEVFHKEGRYVMIGDPDDTPHKCSVVNWKRIVFPTDSSDYYEDPEDAWSALNKTLTKRVDNFNAAYIKWKESKK